MARLRLSEAIRLGSLLHPQGFGGLRIYGKNMTVSATCALGAAEEAGYIRTFGTAPRQFACPHHRCGIRLDISATTEMIIHLNDAHRWTREAIADWVQGIEDAEALDAKAPHEPTMASQ